MEFYKQEYHRNPKHEISGEQDSILFRAQRIVNYLFDGYQGGVAIKLWDGNIITKTNNPQSILQINHPGVLRDLVLHQSLIRLAEAYIYGHIDIVGNLETIFTLEPYVEDLSLPNSVKLKILYDALFLPSLNNTAYNKQLKAGTKQQQNSSKAISHHYDVGNAFYRLWLDRNMVYSCAYFSNETQTLDKAQEDKLDYICRKLRLKTGQSLLDIGCGWGALAIWAAKHYGVKVQGITLSKEQFAYAINRVKKENLEGDIKIELQDYRDLPETTKYDRVVSVGMFEHIGVKNFPKYFAKVKQVLKPGGLFLNHGITNLDGWKKTQITRFMNQYIFPDGELARISTVNDAMENTGFEIVDVESLRRHYALTLRYWVTALESCKAKAIAESSLETYRLWRLYMAGCAYYFDKGELNVYQILVGHQETDLPIPLRREALYIN